MTPPTPSYTDMVTEAITAEKLQVMVVLDVIGVEYDQLSQVRLVLGSGVNVHVAIDPNGSDSVRTDSDCDNVIPLNTVVVPVELADIILVVLPGLVQTTLPPSPTEMVNVYEGLVHTAYKVNGPELYDLV